MTRHAAAVMAAMLLVGAAVARPRSAAELTPAEQSIVRAVDAHDAAARALLERVVNINSGTENLAGVRRVGDVFRAEFDAIGFTTRWVDGASWQRAGHLIAEHPGSGPKLLLIGHLDTVFAPDSPFQRLEPVSGADRTRAGRHRHERWRRHHRPGAQGAGRR